MIDASLEMVAPKRRVIARRDAGQQRDDGAQRAGEEVDRERQGDRDALGVGEGEGLRDELREDDREQRQEDRHDDEGDAIGGEPGSIPKPRRTLEPGSRRG